MKIVPFLFVLLFLSVSSFAQELTSFTTDHLALVGTDGVRHEIEVELAVTPQQQTQGLMFRRKLKQDAGMLFDFHAVKSISMWMKNTLIPLDMFFIGEDGRIVGIAERTIPQSLDIISSPGPIRAVLEMNGGAASHLGIKPGDRMEYAKFSNLK
jgi:hypothetical protein